ncbi:MAG: 30S ribosome-binding factor RbfA [Bacillota bacterium]
MAREETVRRIANDIKQLVGRIVSHEMKDPRIGMTSVVSVDLSPDLGLARIYVSVFGDHEQEDRTLEVLRGAQGFVRSEMGSRLDLKYVPEIQFILDRSIERGRHIDSILREIREGEERDRR